MSGLWVGMVSRLGLHHALCRRVGAPLPRERYGLDGRADHVTVAMVYAALWRAAFPALGR